MGMYESERRVMELLWKEGNLPAKQMAQLLLEYYGWQRTTTYTVIKKCMEKGYLRRDEPGFVCIPQITRDENLRAEIKEFLRTNFCNDSEALVTSLLQNGLIRPEQLSHLARITP